jgi:hypothetical protein
MKDAEVTTTGTDAWKPGKGSAQVNLTELIADKLAEAHALILTSYREAGSEEEFLDLLTDNGFEGSETEWQGKKYQNRFRAIPTGANTQFRVTATLSNGRLSIQYRQWWM